MKRRAGFTVVELIITITIMAILLTISVVNLRSTQAAARDEDRKTDIANIAMYLERKYDRDNGTYIPAPDPPLTDAYFNSNYWTTVDRKNLRAPGVEEPNYSLTSATNAIQTTAGVTPQPTITQYVYQPLSDTNTRCISGATYCRKFNLYYREEVTNTVKMVTSKNQ